MSVLSPWSYSALSTYETCPHKYQHERVLKDVVQISSAQADYGSDAHKAFEERLLNGKELPLQLSHHAPIIERLAAMPAKMLPEHKMGITEDLSPADFDAANAWSRGIADLILLQERSAVVIDWKFGRPHDNYGQLELMALMVMCWWPDIETVGVSYYWAKEKRLSKPRHITRKDDMLIIYNDFLTRSRRMRGDTQFRPKPGFLCRKWCPVKTCAFNGG